MNEYIAEAWPDYELLDTGNGKRLERFGAHLIVRPDPNILWKPSDPNHQGWQKPDLFYKTDSYKKEWGGALELLQGWKIGYKNAQFIVYPTPFRHLAIFPEQSVNWDWLTILIEKANLGRKPRVLNLFAYTGGASVVAALAGAEVCHVDASKSSTYKAKDNAAASGLQPDAIRWIVDDVTKFMQREVRRGAKYDIIIMDPPVFGRGPKGEIWRLEDNVGQVVKLASQLFSEKPLGFLLNFYATALYPHSVLRIVEEVGLPMPVELGVLYLRQTAQKNIFQTGFFVRS